MAVIFGRSPVDYARPLREDIFLELLKKMLCNLGYKHVLDLKLLKKPNSKARKKALLVVPRCLQKRPKMWHAIYMLEVDDIPLDYRTRDMELYMLQNPRCGHLDVSRRCRRQLMRSCGTLVNGGDV